MKRYIVGALVLLFHTAQAQMGVPQNITLGADDVGTTQAYASARITLKQGFHVQGGATFVAQRLQPNFSPIPPELEAHEGSFVEVTRPTAPITDMSELDEFDYLKAQQQVTYVDGMGRAKQIIQRRSSAQGFDIIQDVLYEASTGREVMQYLPYVSATTTGNAVEQQASISMQNGFYHAEYNGEQFPYNEVQYEHSPYGTIEEQGAPGADWQLEGGHTVRTERLFNRNALVPERRVLKFGQNSSGLWECQGYYLENKVAGQKMTDEEGNISLTFTNSHGQPILQRRQMENNEWQDTYFCYDKFGRLSMTIPPLALASQTGLWKEEHDLNMIYRYTYDEKGRLIAKDLPDSEPEYYVYDKLDRVILVQTWHLEQENKWKYTKYDRLGRVIQTGVHTNTNYTTREAMQAHVDGFDLPMYETFAGGTYGYTPMGAFPMYSIEAEVVHYYDHYDFDKDGADDFTFDDVTVYPIVRDQEEPFALEQRKLSERVRGLSTGTKMLVRDGQGQYLMTAQFYDDRGQMIQVQQENHLGGTDTTDTWYGFTGEVLHKYLRHGDGNDKLTRRKERFNYDPQGRLKEHYQQMDDDAPVLVLQQVYNPLGQLQEKNMHRKVLAAQIDPSNPGNLKDEAYTDKFFKVEGVSFLQSTDYQYNIRGWITHINDAELNGDDNDVFGMQLNYNTAQTGNGASPLYNGQISEVLWKSVNSTKPTRSYAFQYDKFGQLTSAKYGEKDNANGYTQALDRFSMGIDEYDLQGNIMKLWRRGIYSNGQEGIIDELEYAYPENANGVVISNKLMEVIDTESAPGGASRMGFTGSIASSGPDGFEYDLMGRMNKDNYKGLTMVYNDMSRIKEIKRLDNSESIQNVFNAEGTKLKKTVSTVDGVSVTDYVGSFIYEGGVAQFMFISGGRVIAPSDPNGSWVYEYNLTDHLGNTRVRISDLNGDGILQTDVAYSEVLQDEHYYPFGMSIVLPSSEWQPVVGIHHRYKYNGKEHIAALNLGWYDYGARMYDPALGRWNAIDPKAEQLYHLTPYNYVSNFPTVAIDPDGEWFQIIVGAVVGAVVDYGTQVVANYAKGVDNPWTHEIDKTSILISAGSGALSGGVSVLSKANKIGKTAKLVADVAIEGAESVAGQVNDNSKSDDPNQELWDIDVDRVMTDIAIGKIAENVPAPQKKVKDAKVLDRQLDRAKRVAGDNPRPSRAQAVSDAKQAVKDGKVDRVVNETYAKTTGEVSKKVMGAVRDEAVGEQSESGGESAPAPALVPDPSTLVPQDNATSVGPILHIKL